MDGVWGFYHYSILHFFLNVVDAKMNFDLDKGFTS